MSVFRIKQDSEFLGEPVLLRFNLNDSFGFVLRYTGYAYFKLLRFVFYSFRQDANALVDGFKEWPGFFWIIDVIKTKKDDCWYGIVQFLVYMGLLDFPARGGNSEDINGFATRMECKPKYCNVVFPLNDFLADCDCRKCIAFES